jgi:hypothetical protein
MSLSPFNLNADIVELGPQSLITSTWSNNTNDLNVNTNFTSSAQGGDDGMTSPTSSGMFHIEVYNVATSSTAAEVQLSLAYGNSVGSGSPDFTNTPDGIYIININRSRYKQKLSAGSLNLHIASTGVHGTGSDGGSDWGGVVHLTDNSVSLGATVDNPAYEGTELGGWYTVVSGSSGTMVGTSKNQITIGTTDASKTESNYGKFYPNAGLIILNGDAFSASFGTKATAVGTSTANAFNTGDQTTYDKPHQSFFDAIVSGGTFIVDTEEQINSTYYFVRARNSQFNYTNNESFTDSDNRVLHSTMQYNPKVFITTVGLYNNAAELVAVAKLSQPVAKDFTKEALIRVKLDY